MIKKPLYIYIILYILIIINIYASDYTAIFLMLPTNPLQISLGNAATAVPPNEYTPLMNPAGLSKIDYLSISANYNMYLLNWHYNHINVMLPLTKKTGALALSLMSFSTDKFDEVIFFQKTGNKIQEKNYLITMSYGRELFDGIAGGSNIKIYNSRLAGISKYNTAIDVNMMFFKDIYTFGLGIDNIGPNLKFRAAKEPIPMLIKGGASVRIVNPNIMFTIDTKIPLPNFNMKNAAISTGIQWQIVKYLLIQTGLYIPTRKNELGILNFLTGGFSIKFNVFAMNYSVRYYGDLGLTHCIGLNLKFGYIDDKLGIEKYNDYTDIILKQEKLKSSQIDSDIIPVDNVINYTMFNLKPENIDFLMANTINDIIDKKFNINSDITYISKDEITKSLLDYDIEPAKLTFDEFILLPYITANIDKIIHGSIKKENNLFIITFKIFDIKRKKDVNTHTIKISKIDELNNKMGWLRSHYEE